MKPISKIGGLPRLPADVPLPPCPYCTHVMTFYVQVVKKDHLYSIFSCTRCSSDEDVYPLMPGEVEERAHVPIAYALKSGSWRLLSSDLDRVVERTDYQPILVEWPMHVRGRALVQGDDSLGVIVGQPKWPYLGPRPQAIRLEDGRLDPLVFEFYLIPYLRFASLPGSPRQIYYNILERSEMPNHDDVYDLFSGGSVYVYRSVERGIPYIFSGKE